jgi:hypothetical protein
MSEYWAGWVDYPPSGAASLICCYCMLVSAYVLGPPFLPGYNAMGGASG